MSYRFTSMTVLGCVVLTLGCNTSTVSEFGNLPADTVAAQAGPSARTKNRGRIKSPPKVAQEDSATRKEQPVKISNPRTLAGLSDDDAAMFVFQPHVALSAAHSSTCQVQLGDQLTEFEFSDDEGQKVAMGTVLGPRLSVVVFWNSRVPTSVEQISRLQDEVVDRYSHVGLQVVAVNVGDPIPHACKVLNRSRGSFINLFDSEQESFARIASDLLPRTYLLDSGGRVLWFDIEYSRSTRRELRNAVVFFLRQQIEEAQSKADPLM